MINHPDPSTFCAPQIPEGSWLLYLKQYQTASQRKSAVLSICHYLATKLQPDLGFGENQIHLLCDEQNSLCRRYQPWIATTPPITSTLPGNTSGNLWQMDLPVARSPENTNLRHVVLGYYQDDSDSRWRTMGTPYSMLLLAGALECYGHSVEICPIHKNQRQLMFRQTPEVVAVGVYEDTVMELQDTLKSMEDLPSVPIVVGGPMLTLSPMAAVASMTIGDVFIRGEAEHILPQVVSLCVDPKPEQLLALAELNGVLVAGDEYIVLGNFDKSPVVASLGDVAPSFNYLTYNDRKHGLEYSASRGCPRSCVFCSHVHGKTLRRMSDRVVKSDLDTARKQLDKIQKIDSKHPVTLNLNDDDLLLDLDYAIQILQKVSEAGFLLWGIQTSIEALGNPVDRHRIFKVLNENRSLFVDQNVVLWIGTDTFINSRLNRLAKKGTESMIFNICEDLEKHKFQGYHYWILTDAESDWQEFIDELLILANLSESFGETFHVLPNAGCLIPYASTPIYRKRMNSERYGQIVLKEMLRFDSHFSLAYPLILHEIPEDPFLYALVEPRSIAPERFLVQPAEFIRLLRQGRFTEALMQALNVLTLNIENNPSMERRTELIEVKKCIMNRWYQ